MTADEEVGKLKAGIEWIMQIVHQAYHDGDFSVCSKETCSYARRLIAKENAK